ncbi:NUDIX domain-containing protein [Pseudoalteromonas sp. MMG013]|uniref:nucleotide triphosphate diphosphatase NUDT15 n=1 Tax=Pseudoalteromonas sp. MMG013 TaxID=2822687 RepID=UPI001B37FDF6|nr:NUDIX hydrolase [Pseudoalteromonas sp. MMG013]MBQ4863009.1 NUDIX domain-containing protein [Pseudoalteromonas sp. MMG013]
MRNKDEVRVGVGVIIVREGKILLGKRIGAHGAQTWATPGGHLDFTETPEQCAAREAYEETGLVLGAVKKLGFTNDIFKLENKHYVTLFMLGESEQGEAHIMEPTKCLRWQWFDIDTLPEPLFLPLVNLLKEHNDLKQFMSVL